MFPASEDYPIAGSVTQAFNHRSTKKRLTPQRVFPKRVLVLSVLLACERWNLLLPLRVARKETRRATMTNTIMLVDHEAIRDWAAARAGSPAI